MTLKRGFDLLVAVPGLIVLSPLFGLIVVRIKLDSRGPALFRQIRVGRHGKQFKICKFRTMVVDAERHGAQITPDNDIRITRSGRILRKLKLDELPQLLNVVCGEMSLVGPRPEVPIYVERYTPEQRAVLDLIPGITDPASIRYRDEGKLLADSACPDEMYVRIIMPEKIRLNLEYGRRANLVTDMMILLRTVACVFRH